MNQYPSGEPLRVSGMMVNDMPDEERPREKALRHGIKSLDNAELMAILFATGIRGMNVIDLSRYILASREGHLSKVAAMDVREICREFKGIGPAKALTLLAALELGARATEDAARLRLDEKGIRCSKDVWELMHPKLQRLPHEEFWVVYLSQSAKVIKCVQIGRGGVASTVVDVRLIMREALLCLASAIILVHNHPSGNLQPSTQDISLTRKVQEAARIHDIRLNDHIIYTDTEFFSLHDNGRMPS